jgi:biotin synthase-like enzyme
MAVNSAPNGAVLPNIQKINVMRKIEGSPFADTLWHLNLAADWPLGGTSDVSVDLELNSLAPQKIVLPSSYLLSLSGYSTSLSDQEVAMLISAVDNAIIGALEFAGGRALS